MADGRYPAAGDRARERAEVEQAELDLSYTRIYAPTGGYVTHKTVEPGIYVKEGQRLMANMPPEVWVIANFKETQLIRMKEEQGMAMALWAMGVVLAPAIGPILGGWLTDSYGWPWIFYINVPVSIAGIFMVATFVHDPPYLIQCRVVLRCLLRTNAFGHQSPPARSSSVGCIPCTTNGDRYGNKIMVDGGNDRL